MAAGSLAAGLTASAVVGSPVEVLLGMLAPMAVAAGTLVLAERTYRRDPVRLTAVMTAAFAGKMVFFGAYVALMLGVVALRPAPFVGSFAGFFIALHVTEAFCLRRLFAGEMRAPR